MLRLRLICPPDQADAAIERLSQVFELIEVSPVYPCRGHSRNVRIYLEVQ